MSVHYSKPGLAWILGKAFANLGESLWLHLVVGRAEPNPRLAWTNLQEASFNGYAPVEIKPEQMEITTSLNPVTQVIGPLAKFAPTDDEVGAQIIATAITYGDTGPNGPQLLCIEPLQSPHQIGVAGSGMHIVPVLSFQQTVAAPRSSAVL